MPSALARATSPRACPRTSAAELRISSRVAKMSCSTLSRRASAWKNRRSWIPMAASASFPSSPTVSFCPPCRSATMSSRAWRTRTFSFDSVSVSASAMRLSMRACMSSLLPSETASSTSFRSSRATAGSRPRDAFIKMICKDCSMIVRKCESRALSAEWRARATSRRAAARSFASTAFVRSTRICSKSAASAPRSRKSSASTWRLANAFRTVWRRDASRTASWASFASPRTFPYSFATSAISASSRIASARLTSTPFRRSRAVSRADSRRPASATAYRRASCRLFRALCARRGMSAYTPRRSASRAWVRTFRASAMFTPSRRAASTSAAARSKIVSERAYLRCASAFSIAFEASGRMRWYSRRASAFRASARWLSASSTFPPRSSAYRTRVWAFSTIPWRTRSRRWSSVRMETRRSRRSAATKSPRPARARAWSIFLWNANVSMPAFFAPSRTASAQASASATRALRRAISRTRREARARSSARPRSPAASVCSARSKRLRANDGSVESRLEGTRSLRAAAIARFVTSGAARVVRPRSNGCPHTSHADRPSGTSDSHSGQRAMWLQPRGCPPHREGMTPLDVGSAGINEASSISHLITVWLGPVPGRFPKSFSSRAPFAHPSGPSRAGRTPEVSRFGRTARSFARRNGGRGRRRRRGRLRLRRRGKHARTRRRIRRPDAPRPSVRERDRGPRDAPRPGGGDLCGPERDRFGWRIRRHRPGHERGGRRPRFVHRRGRVGGDGQRPPRGRPIDRRVGRALRGGRLAVRKGLGLVLGRRREQDAGPQPHQEADRDEDPAVAQGQGHRKQGHGEQRADDESETDHRMRLDALLLLKVCEPGLGGATNPVLDAPRTGAALLGFPAAGHHVLSDAVGEDAAAGHEDVRAPLRDDRCRVDFDPAIGLDCDREMFLVDVLPGGADFRHDIRSEGLPGESGRDRHDEQQVDVAKVRNALLKRRGRVQDDTGADPGIANRPDRSANVVVALHVDREVVH